MCMYSRQELYDEVPIGWHTLMFAFSLNFNPIWSNNLFIPTACWWGFGGQDFIGQISSSFGANQVLSDPMADCLVPLAFIAKVVPLIELLRLKNETYGEMKVGGINASASRIIGGPENPYSLQSWKDFIKASTNYQFSPKAIFLCEGVATFHMTMSIMAENNITDPRFLLDGDAGMLKWLQFTHIATAFHMGMTVLGIVCGQRYTFGELFKQLRRKKHLMSDDIFYRRAASLAEKRRGMFGIWMLVLVLYTIMMPAGMAMQVYGVKDTSTWISPLNAIFNQPGAEINMHGTPVHFLVCKVVFAIACCAVCLPDPRPAPPGARLMAPTLSIRRNRAQVDILQVWHALAQGDQDAQSAATIASMLPNGKSPEVVLKAAAERFRALPFSVLAVADFQSNEDTGLHERTVQAGHRQRVCVALVARPRRAQVCRALAVGVRGSPVAFDSRLADIVAR